MMRGVGYRKSLPIESEDALTDLELPVPEPKGHDLLVEVRRDRKSTRLNPSHANISYAVFCLKKKIRGACEHPIGDRAGAGRKVPPAGRRGPCCRAASRLVLFAVLIPRAASRYDPFFL